MNRKAIDAELQRLVHKLRKNGASDDDISGALAGALFDIRSLPFRRALQSKGQIND